MTDTRHECEDCKALNIDLESKSTRPKLTTAGKIILGVTGVTFGLVCAVTTPFILPAARKVCLPYVPATTKQVANVLQLLRGKKGRLIDLGSGDGRIVIEAAKLGFKAEGVELNPWLVWYSRISSIRQGTSSNTRFTRENLWKTNLSQYEHVVIFGVDSMMVELGEKVKRELCDEGEVIACRFPMLGCKPVQSVGEGIDTVWLYTRKDL